MKKEQTTSLTRRNFIENTAKSMAGFIIVPRFVLGGKKPDGTFYTPPSDTISLGFIGTGKQGKGLAPAFLNTGETRIIAASDAYQAKAQAFVKRAKALYEKEPKLGKYSDIAIYKDFRELLSRKDIDAVIIASPDHWHAAMAVRAAEQVKIFIAKNPCL